ncbi:MAG: mannose-1-phosphate guanylyltransferase [Candidatus Aureabacteria bacterium]|nr:mannose-1-phosphate guanylyltransferase [Candidatus Auribacterota bacterium]
MRWVVIMAGGSGERFWPLSRTNKPKQLLNIAGRSSLVRQAYQRARLLCPAERICVVTGGNLKSSIRKEIKELPEKNIFLEPMIRDTAACIGLSAFLIQQRDSTAVMAVFPADHVIKNASFFKTILKDSFRAAREGYFITLGIRPSLPSTAYGYIEKGKALDRHGKTVFYSVRKFHEKPGKSRAKRFFHSGRFFWNSGIFVWKAEDFLLSLKRHLKKTYDGLSSLKPFLRSPRKIQRRLKKIYPFFPRISVDYAVMEKVKNVLVAIPPRNFLWDDIGSWSSLERHYPKDRKGNVCLGQVLSEDAEKTVVVNRSSQMLAATVGTKDLVIVLTDDALLVCPKERDQDIKKILKKIDQKKQLRKRFR